MTDVPDARAADRFVEYQATVASRLRYEQAQRNLEALHDLTGPLRALDAAGGNGVNTEWLLARGHSVTLLDSDPAMLERARLRLAERRLLGGCRLVLGTLEQAADVLPPETFHLVLCHHAVEYTDKVPDILRGLAALAVPGGELSLITLNPVSEVIRAAVFRQDAALASGKLEDPRYDARWFGAATLYTFEQLVAWAVTGGWRLKDFRAIRVLADYIPETAAGDSYEAILTLESALADREPYRRFGRYLQFAFTRVG